MPLEEYQAKRDFARTPEPVGGSPSADALRFVIQQHHASRMHWDFRLELDGVLLSWAVPKGPSLDPADKRLAVRVEDHPLDYADFEGTIPAGEYGGGSVIVWDSGTWEPLGDPHATMAKGDFKFHLNGTKLVGGWVLVRLKPRGNERGENWLLIKERDEHVVRSSEFDVVRDRPESIVSGLTVDEVGAAPAPTAVATPEPVEATEERAPAGALEPPELALCTLVSAPPTEPGWLAEVKYDGYRLTIAVEGGRARCFSRNGADVTKRFAGLGRAAAALPAETALLDGEAVVFDERGATDFSALQGAIASDQARISFAAFDLLHLNGHDITGLPTTERKALLTTLVGDEAGPVRVAPYVSDGAAAFHEIACAQGLEGAVYKRADSGYPAGRTKTWLKVKCRQQQEFVVVGVSEPAAGRTGFGAVLVAVQGDDGVLRFAGRVGSGFTEALQAELLGQLEPLVRATPPLDDAPATADGRAVRWVEPRVVVEVAFAEWTSEGRLRQPSFKGMLPEANPHEVRRREPERPALESEPTPAAAPPSSGNTVAGIRITHPDKTLFPDSGFSKVEFARYFETVAPLMLTETAERPLTLVRCPVGDGSKCFYQRHPDKGLPAAVGRFTHALAEHDDDEEWLVVRDAAGLVSLAQMGVAEVHTWLSSVDTPSRPDIIVLDLDPGPGVTWPAIADAARLFREHAAALGFEPHVKSTGSKGLHIVLPIEPVWEFVRIRAFARAFAERVCALDPDRLTPKMAKNRRDGRIFVDYLRNSEGASVVAPYSTRFLAGPSVAVPLAWEELDEPALDIRAFTPEVVLARMEEGIDPWRGLRDAAVGARVLKAAEAELSG
ncbi:MAG: DNA ligase D [Coriobacteriia bacterium]|nr:DNA ligase D [Coriobacteriia bacterium]